MSTLETAAGILATLYGVSLLLPALAYFFIPAGDPKPVSSLPFISIVVPARNEEKHIGACLESLLQQQYPVGLWEIIIIDDHSSDNTRGVAEQIASASERIRILQNDEGEEGKKQAIMRGVRSAQGEIIATTDGDTVVPSTWLNGIAATFADPAVQLAAGAVIYKRAGFLRDMLQAEQFALQLVSLGAIKMQRPLMCSGANLAYRKLFFGKCGGYAGDAYASGDDMFLLQKAEKLQKGSIAALPLRECLARTNPVFSAKDAVRQRARWISKFRAYNSHAVTGYGLLILLMNLFIVTLGFSACFGTYLLPLFLWTIAAKTFVDLLLLSLAVILFHEPLLLFWVPAGEIFYPMVALTASVKGLAGGYTWKDRVWKK